MQTTESLALELVNNWKRFGSYMRWEPLPDGFAVVYTSNRDSDALDRSNARVIAKALKPFTGWIPDGEDVSIESSNHWAVGHVGGFAIRVYDSQGNVTKAFETYAELKLAMTDYPILDEDDFSEEEMNEAHEVWANCYSPAERIEYIARHRSQFDFSSFADMLGCVRGNYFAGYASELISG